ncbi:Na(+) H(+) antiporter subunit H [hydrothermal vent metagenome]|uniref:Na(+) H(+) antiporter subunit H n=1 Tax=hydrothermal vent metagenome TaxID=652676 RepID=A0A3B0W2S2_9ZZZZ
MTEWVHPGVIIIAGTVLVPFLRGGLKKSYMLLLPLLALVATYYSTPGTFWVYDYMGIKLTFGRIDALSIGFSYAFALMAFIGMVYSLHIDDDRQNIAALLYAGSSLGAVFAGDLFTLFLFWEIMAFSSAYLIFAGKFKDSTRAGTRYLLVHIAGGLFLLAGILIYYVETHSLAFGGFTPNGPGGSTAYNLILIGFILNAGVPPLSAWLSDAYPEGSITGSVFLATFTTKTAIYVLIRGFSGAEILIILGVIMALYGILYTIIENDCRRLLSYHIISQVGYMVAAVGIGTEAALNGSAAHAFTNIFFKGLLFMGAGAVIYVTGTRKLTELGGIYRKMPKTMVLFMVGAFAISGFPLFSGFVSKAMIIGAAHHEHMPWTTLLLSLAAVGTFLSVGLKLAYHMFFRNNPGNEVALYKAKEPPLNMLAAMAMAAFICIGIGVYPRGLFNILPFATDYNPYTMDHVTGSLLMLGFTALAFFIVLSKLDPHKTISIDTDWFYRKSANMFIYFINGPLLKIGDLIAGLFFTCIPNDLIYFVRNPLGAFKIGTDTFRLAISGSDTRVKLRNRIKREKAIYPGDNIKHWTIGSTVVWVALFLLACLLIDYI